MTSMRLFFVAVLAVAAAESGFAQSGAARTTAAQRNSLIPSVQPVEPVPAQEQLPPELTGMPPGRPSAAAGIGKPRTYTDAPPTALDRVAGTVQPAAQQQPDPLGTLTGQPSPQHSNGQLPPGAYPSPYFTDGPGCCGPLGRHGRVGYELYSYTGPTWAIGEGEFTRRLQTGWMVGGGGRSLFFDASHTRAWVLDVGLSYQYNRGELDDPIRSDVRQPVRTNPITGEVSEQPDILTTVAVRALHRTNVNFGIGHDWWYWGPGSVGLEQGKNLRVGGLIGGRWGTAHVDLEPVGVPDAYARRQGVTHGIFLAAHATCEIPMGTWIFFAGLRTEWGYDWTNLVPPMNGNMHNINFLLTSGIRF